MLSAAAGTATKHVNAEARVMCLMERLMFWAPGFARRRFRRDESHVYEWSPSRCCEVARCSGVFEQALQVLVLRVPAVGRVSVWYARGSARCDLALRRRVQ